MSRAVSPNSDQLPTPTPGDAPRPTSPRALSELPAGQWRSLSAKLKPAKLPTGLDALWVGVEGKVRGLVPRRSLFLRRAARIERLRPKYKDMTTEALLDAALQMNALFAIGKETARDVDHGLALAAEAGFRKLGFYPHRVQFAAALAIEHGCCAELATGEGKTLVGVLAATLAGWRARGCHVITANDYLAKRDAETMAPVYKLCGLTVRHVEGGMEPPARKAAYAADVTYATNKEAAADFLRDRIALGRDKSLTSAILSHLTTGAGGGTDRLVMRGLAVAIVDEADSVLIDEAVTPLIISGSAPNAEQVDAYRTAADFAKQLDPKRDYVVDHRWREVRLTERARAKLDEWCAGLGGLWAGQRRREEMVTLAVTANELYERDQRYVISDGKVVIVDETTGRLMPDRSWRNGVHQAIEAKEGLEIQPPKQTLARVSFQRFFRMYRKLGGMTGTAWEARGEMWRTYRTPTVRIPTHKPCRRRAEPMRVFPRADRRWAAVVERTRKLVDDGRAVLIGTRSVDASETLSRLLNEAQIEHRVLNAVRHEEEAAIVAEAGGAGKVTVATNMAGRGTDIRLDDAVRDNGGLVVVVTELNETPRVDRQLFGRCARQGDPGQTAVLIAADEAVFRRNLPAWRRVLLRLMVGVRGGRANSVTRWVVGSAQTRAQKAAVRQRAAVQKQDDWLDENLSFAGSDI